MSTLKVSTLQNLSGTEVYTAKAWVNFNGTGTVAIRASGNVSSITDNGTGDYTVNFTTAFSDINYTPVVSNGDTSVADLINLNINTAGAEVAPTTLAFRMTISQTGVAFRDQKYVSVSVFR